MYGGCLLCPLYPLLASLMVGRKFTISALFYFVFDGNFQVQAPGGGGGGLYLEGRLNGEFFALRIWGAYIWRGLFSQFYGIIIGINECNFLK